MNHIQYILFNLIIINQNQRLSMKDSIRLTDTISIQQYLFTKYSDFENKYLISSIEAIVDQRNLPISILLKQQNYLGEQQQFLKRQYKLQQFSSKIEMLSEYYKFHRNIPKCYDHPIDKILGWYYNKYRHIDYKNMKNQLKKQQNISITTQKSQTSYETSSVQKKSRYSNLLGSIGEQYSTDSYILNKFCQKNNEDMFKKNKIMKQPYKRFTREPFCTKNIQNQDHMFEQYLKQNNWNFESSAPRKSTDKKNKPINFRKNILSKHKIDNNAYKITVQQKYRHKVNKKIVRKSVGNKTASGQQRRQRQLHFKLQKQMNHDQKKLNGQNTQRFSVKNITRKKSQLKINNPHKNLKPEIQQLKNKKGYKTIQFNQNQKSLLNKKNLTLQLHMKQQQIKTKQTERQKFRSKSLKKILRTSNQQQSACILQRCESNDKLIRRGQSTKRILRSGSTSNTRNTDTKENQNSGKYISAQEPKQSLPLQNLLQKKLEAFKTTTRIF